MEDTVSSPPYDPPNPRLRGERARRVVQTEARADRLRRRSRRGGGRIPGDLERIVLKAMERKPASRYAPALVFTAELRQFSEGATVEARAVFPRGRGVAARGGARAAIEAGFPAFLALDTPMSRHIMQA